MENNLLEINKKLDNILKILTPTKLNKSKQEINKTYYQKMKETDNEKYVLYLEKCRNRYLKKSLKIILKGIYIIYIKYV